MKKRRFIEFGLAFTADNLSPQALCKISLGFASCLSLLLASQDFCKNAMLYLEI